MKLLSSPFSSMAHALVLTLREARATGETEITVPKGEYHIYADECTSPALFVSNHGHNGFKACALLIEDFDGFTFDGGGSKFILHGCMDFAVVKDSANIKIKDLTVTCADCCNFEGIVTESTNERVVIKLKEHPLLHVIGNRIFQKFEQVYDEMGRSLDYITETRELRPGTGDDNFGVKFRDIKKELSDDTLTLYDVPVAPPVGDTIVFTMSRRCNQAFFVTRSSNVTFSRITVNTCWGMAFIAQKTENITINECKVTPETDRCWSAGQDATHFVNCRGLVTVRNSLFENQLDDAVNLHGIYTRVESVNADSVMLKYSHFQTVGIEIYEKGDRVQFMYPDNQMPCVFAEVERVDVISPKYTALVLKNIKGEIKVGQICENLSDVADAIIEGNVVRNNRARGMLIAAKGHIEIKNNTFHSGGAAIQFESDPFRWYECGGTEDVVIEGNLFDMCRHGKWSRAVIDINKRRETVEGFYYHKRIKVINNRFVGEYAPCVASDNVGELIFENNECTFDVPVLLAHTRACINGEYIEKE